MTDCVRYPDGAGEPQTPLEALRLAKALLEQEGRWLKGSVYTNQDEDGYEMYRTSTPYCGNWKVCATGAVFAVTIGLSRAKSGYWGPLAAPLTSTSHQLYRTTVDLLNSVTPQDDRQAIFEPIAGAPFTDVVWIQDYNDYERTTLADILAVFDAAILKAQEANDDQKR